MNKAVRILLIILFIFIIIFINMCNSHVIRKKEMRLRDSTIIKANLIKI